MPQLFDHLDHELLQLETTYPDGPTRFAIERQRRNYSKRFRTTQQAGHLRDAALADFWGFHASEAYVDRALAQVVGRKTRSWFSRFSVEDGSCSAIDELRVRLAADLSPGPGSSLGEHKGTSPYFKLTSVPHVSSRAAYREYLDLLELRPDLQLARSLHGAPQLALGSRVTTVPKDNKKDRVIAVEPEINVELQTALGKELSRVCGAIGLDLSTQQDCNRYLAWRGSITGDYATVDLSRASDSITLDLLREVLPGWLLALVICYSSPLSRDGTSITHGRIVLTMGNGITFPLQTIIFAAIACIACERTGITYSLGENVAVFGDDIIVPTGAYVELCSMLSSLGMTVNSDKSFGEGPFRESCGADFYAGYSVRPFMLKGGLDSRQQYHILYNLCMAWIMRTGVALDFPRLVALEYRSLYGPPPVVPMGAPIDGGFRAFRPDQSSRYVPSANGWVFQYTSTRYPRRKLGNEGHPFITQAVLNGWLVCDRTGLQVAERPTTTGAVRLRRAFTSVWSEVHVSERWLYETRPGCRPFWHLLDF